MKDVQLTFKEFSQIAALLLIATGVHGEPTKETLLTVSKAVEDDISRPGIIESSLAMFKKFTE